MKRADMFLAVMLGLSGFWLAMLILSVPKVVYAWSGNRPPGAAFVYPFSGNYCIIRTIS